MSEDIKIKFTLQFFIFLQKEADSFDTFLLMELK